MKIWIRNKWYSLPDDILVVYLEDKDKENIAKMDKACKIYAEFDKHFHPNKILELLAKLRAEGDNK